MKGGGLKNFHFPLSRFLQRSAFNKFLFQYSATICSVFTRALALKVAQNDHVLALFLTRIKLALKSQGSLKFPNNRNRLMSKIELVFQMSKSSLSSSLTNLKLNWKTKRIQFFIIFMSTIV